MAVRTRRSDTGWVSTSSYQTAGAVRIGDRERDQATDCLREHMAAGRLDPAEFDHRIEIALTARYAEDLRPLFADLPAPRPDLPTVRSQPAAAPTAVVAPTAPKPAPPVRSSAGWRTVTAVAWAVAIIACFASGWHLWWLLFVPLVLGGCGGHQRDRHQRRLAARQQRWDAHMRHFEARMERLARRRW